MKYIPKLQFGKTVTQIPDNTRVASKQKYTFPKLNNEQAFNYYAFGTLNSPNNSYNFIQGYKKTPQQQSLSNIELNRVEKLENIQKQKIQESKNLRHAAEVAPYIIPGLGQAMWAGKAVDLVTNSASDGKYKSWGNMVDQKTGSGEFIGDLTNPGYIIGGVSQVLKKPIQRLTDIPRRNLAISEYITPFGYEGKGKEVKKFLTDYVLKGKDKPDISWMTTRSQYDPVRTELRGEAWRKYLNVSKESDKLYIKNSDGTFRYNPEVIPKENIEFQRQAFKNSGNGNASKEYLTEQLQSAKKGYVGNAGGVTSIIDDAGNFTIKDTWDLMPLQQFKWLPKKIQNIEVGKLVGAKPFTVVDDQIGKVSSNFSKSMSIGDKSDIVTMLNNETLQEIAPIGKQMAVKYINNPIVQKTINNNNKLQTRIFKTNRKPIIYSGEKMEIPTIVTAGERIIHHANKPINVSFNKDLINTGELGKHWTDNIVINPLQSKNTATNTMFHESLHNSGYGLFDRDIYDLKASKLFGNDPYLSMGHEAAVNSAEVGKALNLTVGQKFPGVNEMKQLLSTNKGFYKQNVIDAAKLNTTRDYKRLWDAMTGKYFVAPIATTAGYKLTQNKKE